VSGADRSGDLLLSWAARVAPSHTALLVVDMQNDLCAEGGYVERIVGRDAAPCRSVAGPINALVAAARAAQVKVLWLRANYAHDGLPESMRARLAEHGIVATCCAPASWGHDWYGVAPAPGESVIEKRCYDGFVGTALESQLRDRALRTIVFAGVQTNICVEATLRHAQALGFYCVVAQDCVASHSLGAHEASLATIRFVLGDVVQGGEIADLWRSRATPA
jgi:ureidoacrylate peracid hydrolase